MKNIVWIAVVWLLFAGCSEEAAPTNASSPDLLDKGLAAVAAKDLAKAEGIFESAIDNEFAQIYYAQVVLLREGQHALQAGATEDAIAKFEAVINTENSSALIVELAKELLAEATRPLPIEETTKEETQTPQSSAVDLAAQHKQAKNDYLASLQYIDHALDQANFASGTSGDFKRALWDVYDLWDEELNKIYGLLKDKLPEAEMEKLRNEQRIWIKERDEQTDPEVIGYLTQIEVLIYLAQERTLYLIDLYFEQ